MAIARVGRMRWCLISGVILTALFVFAGCGDAPSSSGDSSGTPATGSYADTSLNNTLAECLSCHSDSANPAGLNVVTGDSAVSKAAQEGWLSSSHANYETAPTYLGMPPYAPWLASPCLECHDPQEDGRTIDDYADSSGNTGVGITERPVVGCASCHGSGDEHFGAGDVEFIKPGAERCGLCHNDDFPHSSEAGDRIYEDFASSIHNSSVNSNILNAGGLPQAACGKCHTDEGARKYRDTPYYLLFGQYEALPYSDVQCRTCHDAHNPSLLLKEAGTNSYGEAASAQYMTCTNCHMDQAMIHGVESEYSWGPQPYPFSAGVGNFDSSEIIYDTHFDINSTSGIEGYILDPSNPDVCIECHNVHSADITRNEQWARSAHGGHILDIKERAFLNTSDADPAIANANAYNILNGTDQYGAQRDDDTDEFYTPAWVQMDFKVFAGGSCLRCKTSTGFREFANDPVGFSGFRTMGKFYATGSQKELLYCWACHTSSSGALRDPLYVAGVSFSNVIASEYVDPPGRIANVPDAGGSNICMSCHSGRTTGAEIQANETDVSINGQAFGNFSAHYLSAGGTLFRLTGYEYLASSQYDDYSWFAHDRIGIDISGTGSNGPCVGCHMRSDESHSFEATIRNATSITNIPAFDQTCSACHNDEATLITDMNSLYDGFEEALDVLKTKLEANMALIVNTSYPYYWQSGSPGNAFTAWPDLPTLGAAFNYNLIHHHEEGAYVHNSRYARRLIFDSIDFLEGGASPPNGSIASAYVGNSIAFDYLNNGVRP